MTWGFVGTIVLSAIIIGAWLLVLMLLKREQRLARQRQREEREMQLTALRQVGIDRSRPMDIRV